MKTTLRVLTYVFLLTFLPCSALAQVKEALNSDVLRVKIEQFEKTEITSKSAAVQSIYRRTLLRLYNDFNAALKQDIADLKTMQGVVGGSDPELQKEIASQLQKLTQEQSVTLEKIQTVTADVRATLAQEQSGSAQAPDAYREPAKRENATLDGPSQPSLRVTPNQATRNRVSEAVSNVLSASIQPGNDIAADTTVDPEPVSGKVTSINEQVFKNADEFTPAQLRRAVELYVTHQTPSSTGSDRDVPNIVIEGETQVAPSTGNPPSTKSHDLILKKEYKDVVETPLVEVTIKVEKPGDSNFTTTEFLTDYEGNYSSTLKPGSYVFSVKLGDFKTSIPVNVTDKGTYGADLKLLVRPLGEFSRAIVGFEQAGASAAKSDQKYFFDLTLSHPLPFQKSVDPYFGARGRMWGTVRVTSVPQQISTSVGAFATGFAQQVSEVKVNEVAQGIEFLGGVDLRLTNKPLPFGSFGGQTATKLTLSFIAGGGMTTPFTPRETLQVFKAFAGAPGLPTLPAGTDFVAFVSPDRDRFFRQYYGGLRLQTHYFNYKNPSIPVNRYPAQLDITYGQNEAITGGRLRGGVIRIEGFYPLPYDELKFINLFGTALFRPIRTNINNPLILQPAPADTIVPAANVFLITVPQINRDYYRIGVGIDFISFVKKLGAGQSK